VGLFDRLKRIVTDIGANPPDPNSELGGVPARGRVTRIGNHYVSGGDTSLNRRDGRWVMEQQQARWNFHKIWVAPAGSEQETEVSCYVDLIAHRELQPGVEVPLRVEPGSGAVLGLDVAAWEQEVEAAQGPT
jgi:hypothetical protein